MNNHSFDKGDLGVYRTLSTLKKKALILWELEKM